MKTIKVYHFKDLAPKIKSKVRAQFIDYQIEADISALNNDFSNGGISEEDYCNILGCDKKYAETTSWFIPSCYYEKNKKEVDADVKETLSHVLFLKDGSFVKYDWDKK